MYVCVYIYGGWLGLLVLSQQKAYWSIMFRSFWRLLYGIPKLGRSLGMQREKPFMFRQLHPSAIRGGKIAVVLSLQGETCLAMFFQEKKLQCLWHYSKKMWKKDGVECEFFESLLHALYELSLSSFYMFCLVWLETNGHLDDSLLNKYVCVQPWNTSQSESHYLSMLVEPKLAEMYFCFKNRCRFRILLDLNIHLKHVWVL